MLGRVIVYALLFAGSFCNAQGACEMPFVQDTMTLPYNHKVIEGEYLKTTLKKFSEVTFFRAKDSKLYLKLLVKENFYFDKVDVLEIRSGSKSYYAKDTRQFLVNKTTGLFVIEIFPNYLTTLREEGITSIVFNKAETDFTRGDAAQIRKMAKCLYETITKK